MTTLRGKVFNNAEALLQKRAVGWHWSALIDGKYPINVFQLVEQVCPSPGEHAEPRDPDDVRQTYRLDRVLAPMYGELYLLVKHAMKDHYEGKDDGPPF